MNLADEINEMRARDMAEKLVRQMGGREAAVRQAEADLTGEQPRFLARVLLHIRSPEEGERWPVDGDSGGRDGRGGDT